MYLIIYAIVLIFGLYMMVVCIGNNKITEESSSDDDDDYQLLDFPS